ncbi:M48 family metalloprotease [Desulfobacula sp.]|uniref:M48 family metalloprotease n=1 Tax=Desulfobacula sp. TaxID=2593537 RepID=UPI001DF002C8|nr:M48 family metalloprotease [Desulfobacula sp.]
MKISSRRQFLGQSCRYAVLGISTMPILSLMLTGCKTMDTIGSLAETVSPLSGKYNTDKKASLIKAGSAVAKTFESFTPEQEYYIGRTIGAVVLNKYSPYNNSQANSYVNILGQTLAQYSDIPETFGGYHFLIQDSDEINAFAAPGGLIFVTRGMLKCCENEDALAAVLAHEIGHVQAKHGLQAIKRSRVTNALTTIGIEGAKNFGGEQLGQLTKTFEKSISDITNTMINKGYSRAFEKNADLGAAKIIQRGGYDPNGLTDMLKLMKTRLKPGKIDFAKTHPSPEQRIAEIEKVIGYSKQINQPKSRITRFKNFIGII